MKSRGLRKIPTCSYGAIWSVGFCSAPALRQSNTFTPIKSRNLSNQRGTTHYSDQIFSREKHLRFRPIDESEAKIVSCSESRAFLAGIWITWENISTPSHSRDSVSLILDDGDCFVGDLEPMEYLSAYQENPALKKDWDAILRFCPKHILYSHVNEKTIKR